jgi:hypothetical protein
MNKLVLTFVGFLLPMVAGCDALAGDWPSRENRTPLGMVSDLVRWQQEKNVKESTGESDCFTDRDLADFRAARIQKEVVIRLRQDADFEVIVAALRTLPPETLVQGLRDARQVARPTWRQMGFIDRDGRGQTEAGHSADVLVAEAIVDALASAAGVAVDQIR